MLLRLEDNALLLGAIASFGVVAAAMYFTRSMDWYGTLPDPSTPNQ
jgi:inner membrane protein